MTENAELAGDPRFEAALAEFEGGNFFEAHELWEAIWAEEVGEPRRFLQALVQAAAGYHKAEIGVPGGAKKLFTSALRLLDGFPRGAFGVDLEALRSALASELPEPTGRTRPHLRRPR